MMDDRSLSCAPKTYLNRCMRARRLVDFPYVLVRLRCDACKRAGSYRLARLAVKYGAEILLDDSIVRLSADCPRRDDPRGTCGARFTDMPPRRPTGLACGAPAVSCGEGWKGLS
jgi:hypothetical protein